MADTLTHDEVKDYYGKKIKTSDDLQTNVCLISQDSMPQEAKEALKLLHPDVTAKSYGCGAVYPECVEGCSILDLGSGAGLDCFILSRMVGPKGHITGVDMTPEQVEEAKKHIPYHMQQFGYPKPNVDFRLGYIEKLDQAGLQDNSFDIVISNCVINLTPDKAAVLKEAYRVLKPGGEMYFSDIYSDSVVPEVIRKDPVLWGECLAGALQWKDLSTIATEVGFVTPVLVKSTVLTCSDAAIQKLQAAAGGVQFCSATYRLFKPAACVTSTAPNTLIEVGYKGTIRGHEKGLVFSYHGPILAGCPVVLPMSVAHVIQESRLAPHFTFTPIPDGGDTTKPMCSGIEEFLLANPFELASGSVDVDPPKRSPGGCCGSHTESAGGVKPCCS